MKKATLFLLSMAICSLSFSQKKKDILNEISGFYKTAVSNITYDKPQTEVWSAVYATVMESYPSLIRESETKGYVTAKAEKTGYRSEVTAEIRGEKQPFRVVFTLNTEMQSVVNYSTGQLGPFYKTTAYDAPNIIKLQVRLYEMLIGEIKFPPDLQTKIDTYNASQKKDKNKVIKGKDY